MTIGGRKFFGGNKIIPADVTVAAGGPTITISGVALDTLLELADKRGMSIGNTLAEAIAIQKAVVDTQEQGGTVILRGVDAEPRELVAAT